MDPRSRVVRSLLVGIAAAFVGCEEPAPEDAAIARRAAKATPLPAPTADPTNRVADDARAAHFGQWLFFDPRLSGPGTFSCASCHDPERAFSDGKTVGEAIGVGRRHTPSLLNVAHHRWVGWDGRSDSIWAQALRPMEDSKEMGGDRVAIARLVLEDPAFHAEYEAIFGTVAIDPSTLPDHAKPGDDDDQRFAWEALAPKQQHEVMEIMANLGKALAAYQRRLVSGDAPFDRFMAGDGEISKSAERGMQVFFGRGECWECHTGPLFSDGEFHNIGIPPAGGGLPRDEGRYRGAAIVREDPFNAAGAFSDAPEGPWATVVGSTRVDPETWGAFKTPSLRGVSVTPPYMHAGQFETLEEVMRFYSTLEGAVQLDHHQESVLTPLGLSEGEIGDLVAFLETLEGRPLAPELLIAPVQPSFHPELGTESP